MQYKNLSLSIKEIDEKNYIIRGVFSTNDEDRHGEVVDQESWILDKYLLNPVVLFSHDKWKPAIGKTIELGLDENGNLAGAIQFAVEEYDFAKTIFNLYKGKFMRAFSVGFVNQVTETNEDGDTVTLKKNELLEISTVTVPANALALAKAKGIDITPLEKQTESHYVISDETAKSLETSINELQKLLSHDKAGNLAKVETPSASKGVPVKRIANKAINRAVRSLLEEKRHFK